MKQRDWMLLLGAYAAWTWFKGETAVSLPSGAGIPHQGDLIKVDRVPTPMDPRGFPELLNGALQIVERGITLDVNPSEFPKPPAPDPDYDLPARVFAMQAAFECNDGRSCYHWNLFNVTTVAGMYYLNPESDTVHKYAVYTYPLQAAVAALELVKRKWPDAYKAAYSGAVTAYVRALKPPGQPQFFEADAGVYTAGMLARGKKFGWDSGVAGAALRVVT